MYKHILIPTDGSALSEMGGRSELHVLARAQGDVGLVLGSETNKVLTHSKIPVLVCR